MADDAVKSPTHERMKWMKDLSTWVAEHFKRQKKDQSVLFSVAQYWADEANDAVHLTTLASERPVPNFFISSWGERAPGADSYGVDWDHSPEWNDNGLSIRCFQAYCVEGSQEMSSSAQAEPFAIAHRTKDGSVITWLGRCQRAWLDLPNTALPFYMGDEDGDEELEDREPLDVVLPAQQLEASDVKCLEAIASDPFAEGPRRVWADMFLARNDPRGAFMQQRHTPLDQILDKGEFWLGELNRVVPLGSAGFEYGSLAEAVVSFDASTAELAESPWWLSVHTLRFSGEEEVFSDRMRGLRHVSGLSNVGLLALADFEGTSRLRSLHCTVDLADLDVLNALPLTSLETLSLTLRNGAALSKLKLATARWPKLEHVRVSQAWHAGYDFDEEEAAEIEALSLAELRSLLPSMRRVSVSSADGTGLPAGWEVMMELGKDTEAVVSMARLGPRALPQLLDAMVDGLPSKVDSLVLQPSLTFAPGTSMPRVRGKKTRVA